VKFTSPFKLATAVAVLSASLAITGAASAATAALFGATASGSMPRGLAIDSNGNIVDQVAGEISSDKLESLIAQWFAS
jgi:hypothetical protein